MKTKKRLFVILYMLAVCFHAMAQNAIITGVVVDEDKAFLPGTTVWLKGTNNKTITDINGRYTLLSVPRGKNEVQFSFVGYESKTMEVVVRDNETRTMNVNMQPASRLGAEVVVSAEAKGQTAAINRQLNASGIISAVSGEKLSELPDVNVADAIGRVPGLMVERDGG